MKQRTFDRLAQTGLFGPVIKMQYYGKNAVDIADEDEELKLGCNPGWFVAAGVVAVGGYFALKAIAQWEGDES